jgi:uncharacterized protein (TIGR02145 family)
MKKKNRILIYQIALIGLFLVLAGSCKKNNDNPANTVVDIDGNVYHTVAIGTQTWMVENLKVKHYRNGDPIVNGSGLKSISANDTIGIAYAYENSKANVEIYGWLYNWYAVADGRNIAPIGWHVASDADFKRLVDGQGGDYYRVNGDIKAGDAMRETGMEHWGSTYWSPHSNDSATNISGWTGLPGGFYDPAILVIFVNLHDSGIWWTTTTMKGANPLNMAYCMSLDLNNHNSAKRSAWYKTSFPSIRCLSDKSK